MEGRDAIFKQFHFKDFNRVCQRMGQCLRLGRMGFSPSKPCYPNYPSQVDFECHPWGVGSWDLGSPYTWNS